MAVARREVQITKVYTVEATNEFSDKHDPTPNWVENVTPSFAVGAFHLRIQAEAGSEIGDTPTMYQVRVQAACLTNPLANMFPFPNILNAVIPAVAFNAGGWEYQASEETFTRSWSIPFPNAVLLPGWHTNQVWQFFVTLEDPAGAKVVASFAASERFLLVG